MSNLAKKSETTLVAVNPDQGGSEEILSSNMVIPYVLLMQGLSDLVNERKAQQGDIVRSLTAEVLGGPNKPVEFIPITFRNQWVLKEKINNKFEYRGTEPMTALNQNAPWEFTQNGADWTRTKSIEVFALLPQDIAAEQAEMAKAAKGETPDPDKALMPVLITFRVTSFNAGKLVVNHFAKAKKFGLHGYIKTLKLKCYADKNDKGSFYVYDIEQGSPITPEQQRLAEYWYSKLATQPIVVDESAERESSGRTSSYSKV